MSLAHAKYEPVFVGTRAKDLEAILLRYPTKMAALLPALWIVQKSAAG